MKINNIHKTINQSEMFVLDNTYKCYAIAVKILCSNNKQLIDLAFINDVVSVQNIPFSVCNIVERINFIKPFEFEKIKISLGIKEETVINIDYWYEKE